MPVFFFAKTKKGKVHLQSLLYFFGRHLLCQRTPPFLQTMHFVILLSFCPFVILSFCHFAILSFCHFIILSFCHFVCWTRPAGSEVCPPHNLCPPPLRPPAEDFLKHHPGSSHPETPQRLPAILARLRSAQGRPPPPPPSNCLLPAFGRSRSIDASKKPPESAHFAISPPEPQQWSFRATLQSSPPVHTFSGKRYSRVYHPSEGCGLACVE